MVIATDERGTELELDGPEPRRRRGRVLTVLGVVILAGAGAWWWIAGRDGAAEPSAAPAGLAATAEVTRETIAATERWSGTLGHGMPTTVTAGGEGVVTRVTAPEAQVGRGTELYRLNEQPVVALLGAIPMYRDIRAGDTGADVEQFEANLAALGYDGFDVDDEFTWYTAAAVRKWQDDLGVAQTGAVGVADVVFLPAGGRVDTVHAAVGSTVSPGAEMFDVTGAEQVVTPEVDVFDRDLLEIGAPVTVVVPGGAEVPGTVTSSAVVEAEPDDRGGGGGGGDEDAGADDTVAEVEVTLGEPVDAALLGAPVDVVADVDERVDVLVVPVTALLALAEGGYGLEIVADDGTASIVSVETGLFAKGKVEVTGEGVDEGTVVGVAGR